MQSLSHGVMQTIKDSISNQVTFVTVSAPLPPPFLLEGELSVPNLEKVGIRKKMSAWKYLKSSFHIYLTGGA